jgi:hypothetical protein
MPVYVSSAATPGQLRARRTGDLSVIAAERKAFLAARAGEPGPNSWVGCRYVQGR